MTLSRRIAAINPLLRIPAELSKAALRFRRKLSVGTGSRVSDTSIRINNKRLGLAVACATVVWRPVRLPHYCLFNRPLMRSRFAFMTPTFRDLLTSANATAFSLCTFASTNLPACSSTSAKLSYALADVE